MPLFFLLLERNKLVSVSFYLQLARNVQLVRISNAVARRTSGTVTSGIPSPTLGKNIAMGYIKTGWHKKGTEVQVEVRKQLRKAVLTPMPFSKPNYWRG